MKKSFGCTPVVEGRFWLQSRGDFLEAYFKKSYNCTRLFIRTPNFGNCEVEPLGVLENMKFEASSF